MFANRDPGTYIPDLSNSLLVDWLGVWWRFIDNLLSVLTESLIFIAVNELKFKMTKMS